MSEIAKISLDIKKRLIVHSAGGLVLILVLCGIAFSVMMISENYAEQKQTLENEVNILTNEITTLRGKFSKVKGNTALYQEMMKKSADNKLTLDRQALRDQFDIYRNEYFLDPKLNIEPVVELKNYKGMTSVIVSSDVSASFNALTDVDVYKMMQAMQQELPGAVRVTSLTLRNEGAINSEAVSNLTKNGSTAFVIGEVKFTWLGIKPIDTKDPNAPKPN